MLSRQRIDRLARGLAAALLAGAWTRPAMADQLADVLGRDWPWVSNLAKHLRTRFPEPPAFDLLVTAVRDDVAFQRAVESGKAPRLVLWLPVDDPMVSCFSAWDLPLLDTVRDVERWLDVSSGRLQWLADCENRQRYSKETIRRHYLCHWLPKPTGGWRLVEAPRFVLKTVQRQLLRKLFDTMEPHPAARGFRRNCSIADFAQPHVKQEVVLRFDLRDFFSLIPAARVRGLLTTCGYSKSVADVLAGLCTVTTPSQVWREHGGGDLYSIPHLPQGAPTSPVIANLCAYRLDLRLEAAAERAGAVYTRYADDLAFSGGEDFKGMVQRFIPLVWRIVREEGFDINHRKTRVMKRSTRQHLTGLVVNEGLNIDRRKYDRLKAILTNCRRTGPEVQNRENHPDFHAHLLGRIVFVEQINPARGGKLRGMFNDIDWN